MVRDKLNRALTDLRISVTDRCNFRCGYCMPKDVFNKNHRFLAPSALLRYSDIQRIVTVFAKLGVSKLRLTGGEPLLREDLEVLISKLVDIEGINDVALTTNASLLTTERALSLKQAGVKRINISLDALTPEIYQQINQIPYPLEQILRGIDNAIKANFETVKVNMVVQQGINESDILPMAEFFRHSGAILRFIEFMDVGNHNHWDINKVFNASQIIETITKKYPLQPIGKNYQSEVAKRWQYVDGGGEIGAIASITQPFCASCTRARLSAKGELYHCLFASRGHNLKKLIDENISDAELYQCVADLWRAREDQYSNIRQSQMDGRKNRQKVEMSYIGG